MTTTTRYTFDELLADAPVAAPLIVDGVACHGGFDGGGAYVSPRSLHRRPAVRAWEAQRAERAGAPAIQVDQVSTEPDLTVDQAALLIREGFPDFVIARLTQIGILEGLGATIRNAGVPVMDLSRALTSRVRPPGIDLQAAIVEDIAGTASSHLGHGLFEAHGRDEAGHDGVAGHAGMWFAARDIAFAHPELTPARSAIVSSLVDPTPHQPIVVPARLVTGIDIEVELLLDRMCRLLVIELAAMGIFSWAEELLGRRDLVAGDGEAARVVSFIRQDESLHIAYLTTALSEMWAWTFVMTGGGRVPGCEVVAPIWRRAVAEDLEARPRQRRRFRAQVMASLPSSRSDVLASFDALGPPPAPA